MADQNITIKLTVDGTGQLKKATSDVDKLTKSTDKNTESKKKTGKASETVIKGNKGIAQSNLSSAKGFSKMNQMLDGGGGSSGLVAAYATLAANVFAATAAFNALRGAAAFEQLGEGFTFMANQAGRTMDLVVERLKEVSGEALSTEQALQGASLAISAGFGTDDLEKLTKVARGASLALGRNMADAFDRLTRGAIKLEPEILDELGIMVRLDDATEAYAATIGKTANELTQFQRQTAFINAINEQGIEKYGELAEAVDVNPYDKLAAAFGDLTKAGLSVLNVVLIPFANLFASSSTAMIGGLVLFGSTIITTMIPALGDMAKKAAEAAEGAEKFAKANLEAVDADIVGAEQSLAAGKKRTKTVKDLQKTVKEGGDVRAQALKTERNLQKQLDRAKDKSKALEKTGTAAQKAAAKARIVDIQNEIAATQVLAGAEKSRLGQKAAAEAAAAAATQARIISDATAEISQVGVIAGFKVASTALKEYIATQVVATGTTGLFARAQAFLAAKLGIATAALRLYGTALLSAMPILAGIAIVVGIAMTAFGALGKRFKEEVAGMQTLTTVTEELQNKFDQLNTTINKMGDTATKGDIRIRQLKQSAGIFLEIAGGIEEIRKAGEKARADTIQNLVEQNFGRSLAAKRQMRFGTFSDEEGDKAAQRVERASFGNLKESLSGIAKDTSLASEVLREQLEKEFDAAFGGEGTVRRKGGLAAFVASLKPKQFREVAAAVEEAGSTTIAYDSALTNLRRSLSEGEQDFSKFFAGASQKTEFDGIVKGFNTLKDSVNQLGGDVTKDALKELFDGAGAQLKKFRKEGESTEEFMDRIAKEGGLADAFVKIQEKTRLLQTDLKKLNVEAKGLQTLSSFTAAGTEAFLEKQREIIDKQLELNNAILNEIDLNDQSAEVQQRILKLQTQNTELTAKRKTDQEILAAGEVTEVKNKQKLLSIEEKIAKQVNTTFLNEQKIRKLRTTGSADLNPREAQRAAEKTAKIEFDFAVKKAKLEKEMIQAKFNLFALEQHSLLQQEKITKELYNSTIIAAAKIAGLQINAVNKQIEGATTVKELVEAGAMSSGDPFLIAKAISNFKDESEKAAGIGILVGASLQPMIAAFKELGDEGAAIGNAIDKMLIFTQSILNFNDSVKELKETIEGMGDMPDFMKNMGITPEGLAKTMVGMQVLSNGIGAFAATAAAFAQNQTAVIDKQIEAEKKRDGSSAGSLKKIEAMNKKKEMIERKAFERDKKMKAAQAAIATALGAIQAFTALASLGPIGVAIGAALAATIVAMGAKQISMINSMQYTGGSSGAAAAPQSISVGKRENKVDVSKSSSAGELAYLRGDKGVGSNANNFTPGGASGMRKGYNTGGEILVGEQGPEVIRPMGGGFNVVPNDRMGGQNLNANITINAVDAAGVEDVLMNQRGNIIGMIREAAHEHGEEFIEAVNTGSYGGGTGG